MKQVHIIICAFSRIVTVPTRGSEIATPDGLAG
jgi:hypothetical protein